MALLFFDGFDHYASNSDMASKWGAASGINYVAGRYGGQAASLSNGDDLSLSLGAGHEELVVGFAIKVTASSVDRTLITYKSSANSVRMEIRVDNLGRLKATRNGAFMSGTTASSLSSTVWNYVEIRTKISSTVGEVRILINGVEEVSFDGDTNAGTSDEVWFIDFDPILSSNIDDFYVLDTTGSVSNTYLGDVRVETIYPASDAGPNDFVATGAGTTNADRVSEISPIDDDTTYVEANTVGDAEQYGLGSLTGNAGTVHGIQVNVAAAKQDAGARTIKNSVTSGATTEQSAALSITDTYLIHRAMFAENPDTSLPWTEADVNALEAGFEIDS